MKLPSSIFCGVAIFVYPIAATKYNEYILAPTHRAVTPPILNAVYGPVENPDALLTDVHNSNGVVFGPNSSITLNFGSRFRHQHRWYSRLQSQWGIW